ncbi:MAG: hypothetical protein KDB06_02250 [Ilumatobacter sp.]|nr:hypothetical protein [Ilumatobacter sp.]MCB0983450.1 hypothetical protein [Ilumatobacter sp.]
MRTTLVLDDDVVAAAEQVRREQGCGLSEAVNQLVRRGLARHDRPKPYRHRSAHLGLKVDVSNVADVLELLDEAPTE